MRIVVIGGTGLIGSKVVSLLTEHGHEAVPASPNSGVNTVTGEGVKEVLQGADVVVDVSNSPSFADDDVMAFFRAATTNLTEAAKGAGVGHYVALSVIGSDRLPDSGYLRAKVAQEKLIKDSGLPYSIVRATQFFEFASAIADSATEGTTVKLPDAGIQPIAAGEVSGKVAKVAAGAPINGLTEIAGPEVFTMAGWIQEALTFREDPRQVVTDPEARYFGEKPGPKGLLPGEGAELAKVKFADWLPANPPVEE
ncbi:SDR family oxidoreductase [Amycolatopsis sp. FDAARGOS 1241]|uniref:SDR family oxidoreductase n=1 Tax=Amycolatopsis sp. FDAARGOS 1241 TaxID=2778070 RepID=UPI0019500925|nr:SDR family oxidoreductase [Amycolatopsis sp. FDAARGOS 1241]QRP47792.1 SDR family oxidoreductase [Amycolatopsis sp. FDAARGOS 1241]